MDDFKCRRLVEDRGSCDPPSTPAFQAMKYDHLMLIPASDLQSQKLETMSKVLFQDFDNRALVNKVAGCGIFERVLLLQTRLLLMLQRGDEFDTTTKGFRPLVVAFGRCCNLLLLLHRCDVSSTSDAMLEQVVVNILPFLKEIRSSSMRAVYDASHPVIFELLACALQASFAQFLECDASYLGVLNCRLAPTVMEALAVALIYQISFVRKNIFSSNEIKWRDVRCLRTLTICCSTLYTHPHGTAAFDANGGAPCCLACCNDFRFLAGLYLDIMMQHLKKIASNEEEKNPIALPLSSSSLHSSSSSSAPSSSLPAPSLQSDIAIPHIITDAPNCSSTITVPQGTFRSLSSMARLAHVAMFR